MGAVVYGKTNNGEPLAQHMVVESQLCAGMSSYMNSEFRSTQLQDSGCPLGAQLRNPSLLQEKECNKLKGK